MPTTVFEPLLTKEPSGALALRDGLSVADCTFRTIWGMFMVGVGTLVAYVFLSGGGPKPTGSSGKQILGWVVVALIFTALGVVPIYWGLEAWFMRRTYLFRLTERELESRIAFAGLPLWQHCFPLSAFECIRICYRRGGMFGGGHFIVSCTGPSRRVDVAAFRERIAAEQVAAEIKAQVGLRVDYEPRG